MCRFHNSSLFLIGLFEFNHFCFYLIMLLRVVRISWHIINDMHYELDLIFCEIGIGEECDGFGLDGVILWEEHFGLSLVERPLSRQSVLRSSNT